MTLELRRLVPGQADEALDLANTTMVGSLPSNQITLTHPGVEPIHGMIERLPDGRLRVTDLGTLSGILVNGRRIDVDTELDEGDVLEIGRTKFRVAARPTPAAQSRGKTVTSTKKRPAPGANDQRVVSLEDWKSRLLFQPKEPLSQGRLLEVVAYWGDTILNVDHFHPTMKGFDAVTVGDPAKAHFISGGREFFTRRVLANVELDGCVLKLTKGMQARVRQDGKIKQLDGLRQVHLGPTDYAHVEHGAVRYFLHYANQPRVDLPKNRVKDALFAGIAAAAGMLYLVLVGLALTITPKPVKEDVITITELPFDPTVYQKIPKKKPVFMDIQTVKTVVEPKKPVEPQHPIKPDKPVVAAKQPKKPVEPVHKPIPQHPVATQSPVKPVTPPILKPAVAQNDPKLPGEISPKPVANGGGAKSPAAALTTTPKFNATGAKGLTGGPAGQKQPNAAGNSGGPGQTLAANTGGALKGHTAFDKPGVEGGMTKQPSMPNLKNLGAGLGQVLSQKGGLNVAFNSSAGGVGAKMGSATKDLNMGGAGKNGAIAIPGTGDKMGGWGNGPGGVLGGGNGPGGALAGKFGGGKNGAGPGDGPGFGPGQGGHHAQADVQMPAEIPLVSSESLTPDEILRVIRQHLNEIRHCYEQLLQRQPNAAGRIKVLFPIGADGRVISVSIVDSTIKDMAMRGCVTGKIQRWQFPRLRGAGPLQVTYPFIFNPL